MGRRSRRKIKYYFPKLPKYFECPACGGRLVSVKIVKKNPHRIAHVKCSKCGLEAKVALKKVEKPVDAYCVFCDLYWSSRGR